VHPIMILELVTTYYKGKKIRKSLSSIILINQVLWEQWWQWGSCGNAGTCGSSGIGSPNPGD